MQSIWGNIAKTTLVLSLGSAAVAAHADTIELSNGDTLTGTVTAQTEQGVTLQHPVLGEVVIEADRVSKVTIGEQPGANTDPGNNPVEPLEPEAVGTVGPPAEQPSEAAEQNALEAAEQETSGLNWFSEDWASRLTLGFNGSSGNTDRQDYRIKFQTQREEGRDRWAFNTGWHYAYADGNQVQNQFDTDITRDWLQEDSPWFFFVRGLYKYDDRRSWENRTSAFGGGGYTITDTDDVEINTRLGFGGTYEYGDVNEFTPEALFGGSVVKWNINDRASIAGETVYYPSLQDAANFRVESSLEWLYRLDMARGLSLKLGVENDYDSRTPNDTGNNDVRYYGALVLSF